MDFLDDLNWDEINEGLDEFDIPDEECLDTDLKYHFQYLNQNDYSLNSPLISDDLDGYIAHRRNKYYPRVFQQSDWWKRDILFDRVEVNFDLVKPTDELHDWWADISRNAAIPTKRCANFLSAIREEALLTAPIIGDFYRGWINQEFDDRLNSVIIKDHRCLRWGELFLMMHDLILIMNANSNQEIEELRKILSFSTLKIDGKYIAHKINTHLGPCYIVGKVLYFEKDKVLIDRLFALMMKDTWIARFNTLIGLYFRTEENYSEDDIQYIHEVYMLGDNVLRMSGNEAYDCLKLVEPVCNWKFCEFAKAYRPLIPEFENFKRHVERSIEIQSQYYYTHRAFCESLMKIPNLRVLTVIYGSFRHWGHPFIRYLDGLKALNAQVNLKKEIDLKYADKLGSDLAYLVLRKKFSEDKKWYVDGKKLALNHPLRRYILENIWPTPKVIEDFGDNWNKLPLMKCFDVPDVIDPSLLYADKSHSRTKSEVLDFIQRKPGEVIPTEKVLNTLLHRPSTNWPVFLKGIDEFGLSEDSLIIGLKGKEREVKIKGRFFSLMSWDLREYFVVTEYLIKEHFVPLFNGLTMADDMTTVISKLMDRTQGQGGSDYNQICIANHIDYEKWNNHQRKEATGPVFKVMGQFLGFPNLIYRTHEFFEQSLIYYNGRPDLMQVRNGTLENNSDKIVCWQGQLGGLEGLRQKGWTVVGLLMIRREAKIRNTKVKILAQGDNQVICSQYKLKPSMDETELRKNLQDIWYNNNSIMNAIQTGTQKLGLIINEDETMQSADYLNYGKIPVFRGRIINLFTKRLSRIMCVTNDQLLSFGNIMSTVGTNCLTISHFDTSPRDGMFYHNYFGTMTRMMIERHDPVLGAAIETLVPAIKGNLNYKRRTLYLDPSLGGACGTSLARFLTRAFPDPVSEGLSFWKCLHKGSGNPELQKFAVDCGYPKVKMASSAKDLSKLLEKPNSLNIPKNMSLTNLLKTEIKRSLLQSVHTIENEVIRDAICYMNDNEDTLMDFLWSIDPLFPKFLSEFRSSTFFGVTDGLVGLFQNSRTIRTSFSRKLYRDINQLTWECEIGTFRSLVDATRNYLPIWDCSAQHADSLRLQSWGRKVIGTTVPHPIEMFGRIDILRGPCTRCTGGIPDFITCLAPLGFGKYRDQKGPYVAYLGSRTSESTSILQPWDRECNVSLIKRAVKLRNAIHWFVKRESLLGSSILSVLSGLTGEDWNQANEGFKRTGSALHRFTCSRMSSGGYAACNPAKLSWVIISTDTFEIIESRNYDFMFQPSILYAQISLSERCGDTLSEITGHLHLSCRSCLREIEEPVLESRIQFTHPNVSRILSKWKPAHTAWAVEKPTYTLKSIDISKLTPSEISYQAGRIGGFIIGNEILGDQLYLEETSLFPLSIQGKVLGYEYLFGLLDGLFRSSGINAIHRRNIVHPKVLKSALMGSVIHCIEGITENKSLLSLCRKGNILSELTNSPHKVPPTFPISDMDMGNMIRTWLKKNAFEIDRSMSMLKKYPKVLIFSDVIGSEVMGPYLLSNFVMSELMEALKSQDSHMKKGWNTRVKGLRDLSTSIRSSEEKFKFPSFLLSGGYTCSEEVRHACKNMRSRCTMGQKQLIWGRETVGDVLSRELLYTDSSIILEHRELPKFKRLQSPLIAGLRFGQLATGAHYKLQAVIKRVGIHYTDFLCGGDGSGGMSACLSRINPSSKYIYNSLIEYRGTSLRGSSPGVPPAIEHCTYNPDRCVNKDTAWMEPSDLSMIQTWTNFARLKRKHDLRIDLLVFDMEIREKNTQGLIEEHIEEQGLTLLEVGGTIIYKVYGSDLSEHPSQNILSRIGKYFGQVLLVTTSYSSSFTSELYAVFRRKMERPNKNKYLHLGSLGDALSICWALSNHKSELQRARLITFEESTMGIPRELIQPLKIQLETLLSIMGVETGLSYSLSMRMELTKNPKELISCIVIGVNSVINVTAEHRESWEIPSDGDLKNILTCLIGTGYWICWKNLDYRLYKYLDSLISDPPIISLIKILNTTSHRKLLGWKMGGPGHVFKKINLTGDMAPIGSWIRALGRKNIGSWDTELDSSTLMEFNKGLTVEKIENHTGILDILKGLSRSSGKIPENLIIQGDKDTETTWQS
ncbi:RNA-dependent RNA polymerase [Wenzhou Rhinolophus pusillus ledantevirus 1]|uniref:RNA-dependent RNA polymerase n=1 Tax=Wenzhou Rhinolophus pusillus ledantevirus 1 TaxID=2929007 RepID=UPI002481AFB8|nr:RNA-dependent RNA polymerase [Wenzhou Rhinolophus pusillus ledantevirus 1]UOX72918.1 RNA-dependent RNA polymerase [Wenzhou Rhinolophus pusillus ledantevirus 1]